MPHDRSKLYKIHSQNLGAVDRGIGRIRRAGNRAVAEGELEIAKDYARIYATLLAAKLEVRLRKLLYEAPAFSEPQRVAILAEGSQEGRWLRVIDEALKRRYGVTHPDNLDITARLRRDVLRDAVEKDLLPLMQLRNKLAHGEWLIALDSSGEETASKITAGLRTLNLLSLKHQERLVDRLADAIADLAVSRPTFERDFDRHFRAIGDARKRLAEGGYEEWVERQRRSYRRSSPALAPPNVGSLEQPRDDRTRTAPADSPRPSMLDRVLARLRPRER